MMTLQQNKQKMYYALRSEEKVPIYDYYEDENGNKYPIDTGESDYVYGDVTKFFGNIAYGSGEVQIQEYGLDLSSYEAVLITVRGELPLTETSRLWVDNEPVVDADGTVDEKTADYRIIKIGSSLNFTKYVLSRVTK